MTTPTLNAPLTVAVKKAMVRIIPFLFLCYIISFLDRVNLSFAALRMNEDLGMSDAVYGFGAGIFFIGYFIFEVPSNLLLKRFGARGWICRIMVTWGILSAAMMFVTGPTSFYIVRFLLGVAEAGFFPGVILYLATWFPQRQRARATALFMSAIPISGLIGAPLSGWILGMDDNFLHIASWQLLFVLEGIPAVIIGFLVLVCLPPAPDKVKWLSSSESEALVGELASEEAFKEKAGDPQTLKAAFRSPLVWLLSLAYFGTVTSLLGLGFWLPTMVQQIAGQSTQVTTLIAAIPYLFGAVAMVLVALHSDRVNERRLHTVIPAAVAGIALILSAMIDVPVLVIAMLCLVAAGIYGCNGTFWTIPAARLGGTAAAAGLALINSVGNLGGFVGPFMLGWVRGVTGNDQLGLIFLAFFALVSATILFIVGPRKQQLESNARKEEVVA